MKCPIDNTDLVMSDRQSIEIDYCPQCRGVWLDRGELDKIIDRAPSSNTASHADNTYSEQPRPQTHSDRGKRDEYHHGSDDYRYKKRRKESFLGDLFDF